ncbi:MAG: N-acetylmuramoyl-L-alanine amidase [Cyanobium sp. NAT70]|nr:N-acetylmuramoyl-L-alanine amidase [Cyanobium sp. NAT70]MAR08639.1 N-acetylmuramoyl-L-alanine amidase [Blastopirellula sp.]|tara:strand:+ start:226 stop:1152 length:927 start_codon:yes stop_codon:yes gene_type:complete
MVPDSVKHRLKPLHGFVGRHPLAIISAMSLGSLTLLFLGWFAADHLDYSHAGSRPSLLELLDQVSQEQGRQLESQPSNSAPKPPYSRSWTSPLARQCSGINPKIRQRLTSLQDRQHSWRSGLTIDPTNFGERHKHDAFGHELDVNPRVVVMHETVYSLSSAVNTFMTPHPRDEDQVSYHTLIGLDGRVLDLVPPTNRAYGAGYSAFLGEWAITNKRFKGSVNNFALHVSLETPKNGANNNSRHSGYTEAQYDSLALVLSGWMNRFNVAPAAITTHRHVDQGGERSDPRSFDWSALQARLASLGELCVS